MALGDLLVILGAAVGLVGIIGSRFSQTIARRKRWIVYGGIAVLVLGTLLSMPDLMQGLRDGYKD